MSKLLSSSIINEVIVISRMYFIPWPCLALSNHILVSHQGLLQSARSTRRLLANRSSLQASSRSSLVSISAGRVGPPSPFRRVPGSPLRTNTQTIAPTAATKARFEIDRNDDDDGDDGGGGGGGPSFHQSAMTIVGCRQVLGTHTDTGQHAPSSHQSI